MEPDVGRWESGCNIKDVRKPSQRDGTPMDAGKGKSRDFGLSQAVADPVVRKGVCGDLILCGLSPPVSAGWSLVHRYTFWASSPEMRPLPSRYRSAAIRVLPDPRKASSLNQQMTTWQKDAIPTLVGGDFNVIPEDIDCHKPSSWMNDALFQPEPRERYRALLELGYTDAFRSLHPNEAGQFTFWDHFRRAFEHNRGIRIDHFLLSPTLAARLEGCEIDKGPRALEKPSDHAPIIVTLSDLP
jgi:hypothetical protein